MHLKYKEKANLQNIPRKSTVVVNGYFGRRETRSKGKLKDSKNERRTTKSRKIDKFILS